MKLAMSSRWNGAIRWASAVAGSSLSATAASLSSAAIGTSSLFSSCTACLSIDAGKPTVKQQLAAIRQLFDYLTTGGVLEVNPAVGARSEVCSEARQNPRAVVRAGAEATGLN